MDPERTVLSVYGNAITARDGVWHTHHSFGRIVERLTPHFAEVHYHAPQSPEASSDTCDYPLADPNLTVHPFSAYRNSLQAITRPDRLLREYWGMVKRCDALFLRGSSPLLWTAHLMARLRGVHVVHWIVGNPPAVMRGGRRGYSRAVHRMGILFARFEQRMTRIAARVGGSHLLTNGAELARLFKSAQTLQVVSTSTAEEDFLVRDDTCRGDTIRLLFVGFIRPEKGLEFLLRALPLVTRERHVHLAVVGSWDQFSGERERLDALIDELGLRDEVSWEGYAPFGRALFDQMDRSDILVLPSLSEGTPRVLVEARARSLPVIATRVGGIPSSVTDGMDGLLVPPRDPTALAAAVSRVIRDDALRCRMIRAGRETVRTWTVGRFVDLVLDRLVQRSSASSGTDAAAPQPATKRPGAGG